MVTHVIDHVSKAPDADAPHKPSGEAIVMVIPMTMVVSAVPSIAPMAVMPVVMVTGSPPGTSPPAVRAVGEVVVVSKTIVDVDIDVIANVHLVSPDTIVAPPLVWVPIVTVVPEGGWPVEPDIFTANIDILNVGVIPVTNVELIAVDGITINDAGLVVARTAPVNKARSIAAPDTRQ
jgi:hypothetical protein